jgi:hypothetical protein
MLVAIPLALLYWLLSLVLMLGALVATIGLIKTIWLAV